MTRQAIIHDGRLHVDETGYFISQSDVDAVIKTLHERHDGPERPEINFAKADVERWLAYECGGGPVNHPYDINTKPIIQGEARDTSSKVWLWLIAGAILFSLLVWLW